MKQLRGWLARLAGLFHPGRHENELAAEIESHLQMHIDDMVRSGMSPQMARREALRQLGGVETTKQAYRERSTLPSVESLAQDIRFAVRQLRRNPGFACIAVLLLMVGMGASVAIFCFVDAALIRPLPYRNPTRLVHVTESAGRLIPRANLSYLDYLDWEKLNKVFSDFDVYTGTGYILRTSSGTDTVTGVRVSPGFFRTLGVAPILGRDFRADEDHAGTQDSVVISYATWQKRYGGRRDIIGQTVVLSGEPNMIVGVLPADFQFAPRGSPEFWSTLRELNPCEKRRSCHNLEGIARLKDGVSVSTALADMQAIARQLEIQYPGSNRDQGASVLPLSEVVNGDLRPILLTLLGGAGLLLLIACVNVSSLLLVRSESRRHEIAVRGALGASPSRLVRQFLTEGLVLVAMGCVSGMAFAYLMMRGLLALISKDLLPYLPFLQSLGMNPRVFGFACLVSLFAAVLFAITPVSRITPGEMREGLSEGVRGSGALWRRLGANLVVVELAIAVVLLFGAGLLAKSFNRLLHVEVGFEPDHLATLQVALPQTGYAKDEQIIAVQKRIMERVSVIPGVQSAAVTNILPVSFNGNTDWIRMVGKPFHGEHNEVNQRDVSVDYFPTLRAQLVSGRYFTEADDATRPLVILINQTLAKKYFPGENPIGRKIGDDDLTPNSIREIVGVVNDVKEGPLDSEIWPAEYFVSNQRPDPFFNLVARTTQDEATVLQAIGQAIRQIDPGIGATGEATMNTHIDESATVYIHRLSTWLVGGFASLALLLGVVGLYGVVAYSVSQRTREIGVRMALGAQRSSVYRLVLTEAGWLTAAGVAIGLVCAVVAASLMRKLLFSTQFWDVQTLAVVAAVLANAAFLASFIPARRAASVDPVKALRAE